MSEQSRRHAARRIRVTPPLQGRSYTALKEGESYENRFKRANAHRSKSSKFGKVAATIVALLFFNIEFEYDSSR
jgi:hypothetical protein